ncbi:MAG: hypothetical protein WAK01_09735 [Methylocystis sp.]
MRITWLAAAAVTLALGGTAQASSLYINFAAEPNGNVSYTGTDLGTATSLNFGGTAWTVTGTNIGDQSGLAKFDTISITPAIVPLGSSTNTVFTGSLEKSWTAGSVTYTEDFTSGTIGRGTNAVDLELVGTLTSTAGANQKAYLDISLNQAGGAGNLISAIATNSSKSLSAPGPVPGVGYAGLVALALAGLYTRARRA